MFCQNFAVALLILQAWSLSSAAIGCFVTALDSLAITKLYVTITNEHPSEITYNLN